MKLISQLFAILSISSGLLACSSNASSPNVVDGSVNNTSLYAVSAVGHYGTVQTKTVNGQAQNIRGLIITISDSVNTCGQVHAQRSTNLVLSIPGDDVPANRTYAVVDANRASAQEGQAEADFNAVDGACKDRVAQTAVSGTVTLSQRVIDVTTPEDSHVDGTFDIAFAGGHLTGTFVSSSCDDIPGAPSVPVVDCKR